MYWNGETESKLTEVVCEDFDWVEVPSSTPFSTATEEPEPETDSASILSEFNCAWSLVTESSSWSSINWVHNNICTTKKNISENDENKKEKRNSYRNKWYFWLTEADSTVTIPWMFKWTLTFTLAPWEAWKGPICRNSNPST